uniref:Uncharacterized protein n=1 Tax=Mucochytrium quahogii TaxID=96639 RepID=A0A7S2WCS6_9STRA|mmetsp:Transcript_11750/g.21437  ORF Transcript_11750/g.21437 Transcript_11750/m.21437 type:complete len:172 (-) Transcript_11750:104-619(-)
MPFCALRNIKAATSLEEVQSAAKPWFLTRAVLLCVVVGVNIWSITNLNQTKTDLKKENVTIPTWVYSLEVIDYTTLVIAAIGVPICAYLAFRLGKKVMVLLMIDFALKSATSFASLIISWSNLPFSEYSGLIIPSLVFGILYLIFLLVLMQIYRAYCKIETQVINGKFSQV